jgi:predicted O-methyltransferase YrrM
MITHKNIEKYITDHTTAEDPLLAELNRETYLKALNPRMLSGHPQGRVLEMISKLIQPETILEIGTYTGYSALCLAKGLRNGGKMHTIEYNDEIVKFPKKYFKKAGLENKITLHVGDALRIIPTLNTTFDLIFIDADKKQYLDYYNLCINHLNPGGIILTDNVLWDGKVVRESEKNDPDTKAILDFNKTMANDDNIEVIILPVRDGISVVRKKSNA